MAVLTHEHRPLRAAFWLGLALGATGLAWTLTPPRDVDLDFSPLIRKPPYGRRGPRVLIDEAHWNTHTAQGRYRPFAKLLSRDGYRVSRNRQALIPELLETCDVLVSVNPRGLRGLAFDASAFAPEETDAVRRWVGEGGGLLLVVDRPPAVEAARPLIKAFGIEIQEGAVHPSPAGSLPDAAAHPIRFGRIDWSEQVTRLALSPGPVLRGVKPGATEIVPSRAMAVESGKGRVVILTDSDALTALIIDGEHRGINGAVAGNRQFALNMLHWLSKLI